MTNPSSPDSNLSKDELIRYSRQLMLAPVGKAGQEKLKASKVLLVGVGGLGCPAAQYLSAAGVGELWLLDDDEVALSNLQRQILFGQADIGQGKAQTAAAKLQANNPNTKTIVLAERADAARLAELCQQVDIVLDCSDNFDTRHAVNRACQQNQTPLVSGAAVRMEGQMYIFDWQALEDGQQSPCYHCLFPENDSHTDNCATAGILAPVTGIIGSFQALAALRLIIGQQPSGAGKLWLFDANTLGWRQMTAKRDPACPVCQPNAT